MTKHTVSLLFLTFLPLLTKAEDKVTLCDTYRIEDSVKSLNASFNEELEPDVVMNIYGTGQLCTVNVTDIYLEIDDLKRSILPFREFVFVKFSFVCGVVNTEFLFETGQLQSTNKSQYLIAIDISPCIVSVQSLNELSRVGIIFQLTMNFELVSKLTHRCDFSEDIRTLELMIYKETYVEGAQYQTFFEQCRKSFSGVYIFELRNKNRKAYVVNSSWIDMLPNLFPYLQSLVLDNVIFQGTLAFPWTKWFINVRNSIYGNLSFASKPDEHGSVRTLQLSNLDMKINFKDRIQLNGYIDNIYISGLVGVFTSTFLQNVSGLREVDMSRNRIVSLQQDSFSNQHYAYRLDLKGNLLAKLSPHIFDSLISLAYLDLSDNRLRTIGIGVFDRLINLEILHLENNFLQSLPPMLFRHQLDKLVDIYLFSNPLTTIPIEIIYAPFLKTFDLHNTNIGSESFYNFVLNVDLPDVDVSDGIKSTALKKDNPVALFSIDASDKTIDLSNCQIRSLLMKDKHFLNDVYKYVSLFVKLTINFNGNPIYCACNITDLQLMLLRVEASPYAQITSSSLFCESPSELRGRRLLSVKVEEMYCPNTDSLCPLPCACFTRLDNNSIIVDCRHVNISEMPLQMPTYKLELWFHNSYIKQITSRDYFVNVTFMDVSQSKVQYIEPKALRQLTSLKTLYMDSNLLSTLPIQLKDLNLSSLALRNNPFLCDCRLGWMKPWLLNRESPVIDWQNIKCTDGSKRGTELVHVDDSQFTCVKRHTFSSTQHVILPSIITGCILFLLTVSSLMVYFQRLTVKTLLYVYCGIHPFDKDIKLVDAHKFDAVVIYSFEDREFMQEKVVNILNDSRYQITDMYMDFIVGMSFTENVRRFIQRSRRLIICLSAGTLNDELMKITWALAYEKAKDENSNFIILIKNDIESKSVRDKSLLRYIRNGRYLKINSPILQKQLKYLMPDRTCVKSIERTADQFRNPDIHSNTLICYPDDVHFSITQELLPCLKKFEYSVRIMEYEFTPGGSIGEEVVNVIDKYQRLIFILSEETFTDEVKMLILKVAISKTLTCGYNFLLLFTHGEVRVEKMSSDLCNYVNTHVTSNMGEADFFRRLLTALSETRKSVTDEVNAHVTDTDGSIELQDGVNIPLV